MLARVERDDAPAVLLVYGDPVLAEPAGRRLATALARRTESSFEVRRRPARLSPLLGDLRTYSLFGGGRVLMVVESAALADAAAVAGLIDELEAVLPVGTGELGGEGRQAGARLMQALRLHRIDPWEGSPVEAIGRLPDDALQGARRDGRSRRRGSRQVATLREQLAGLLAASRAAELQGWDDSELAELARAVTDGLPPGHALVLVERDVAPDHPVLRDLAARNAAIPVGSVEAERGGTWAGVQALAEELAGETGQSLPRAAVEELARRTLRGEATGKDSRASAASTARFAAEYRKLADLAASETVDRSTVERVVADRGEEDVWQILDALGAGRLGEALERCERALQGAADPVAARLQLFGLLAGTCRTLTAVAGLIEAAGVPGGVNHYGRFQSQILPRLQASLPEGAAHPLRGQHPYRLHRSYLAAGRIGAARARRLTWQVLETERRLKGGSDRPEAALAVLLGELGREGRDAGAA